MHSSVHDSPAVSVILGTRNEKDTIEVCLRSIEAQRFGANFEVIVVDSSTDGTDRIIRELFPQVHLIHSPTRIHHGTAKNMAIERAAADLFAFTDGDCIVARNWLQTACDCFSGDSELEAVIGAVDIHAPFTPVQFAEYCLNFLPISSSNPPRAFISGATANLLIRRRLVERIGGFPDTPLYVDVRYMNTMAAARAKTLFVPQAIVYHVHSTNIPKLIGRNYHRGKCVWLSLDGTNSRREFVIRWLFPVIGLYRLMAIVSRILRRHRQHLVPFVGSLPLLLTLITVNQGGIVAGCIGRIGRHIGGRAGFFGTREQ